MYIEHYEGVSYIGWVEIASISGLCMGEIYNGNETSRDDFPLPYLESGELNQEYSYELGEPK